MNAKQNIKQLKANRWRLVTPAGQYAGLGGLAECQLVSRDEALVFDGRDNEASKIKYWSAVMRVPFTQEMETITA